MGEKPAFAEGFWSLGKNSHAWMVPNGSWGETNIGLIRGERESLLIDTGWDLRIMREVLDHAAPLLEGAPITQVINTHSDGDHCWGNQLFADTPIIATDAAIAAMHHHTPFECAALKCACSVLRHLPVGAPRKFASYMHTMFRPYHFAGIRLTAPTTGFSGRTAISLGAETVKIIEVGPGHSAGDCLVHLPDRKIVFAGDILFAGVTPVAWSGPIANITAALKLLLTLNATTIVPGHGPLATPAHVQAQIDYWDYVQSALAPHRRSGTLPHIAARKILESPAFRATPFASWPCPERLVTSAHIFYETPTPAPKILMRQASIAYEEARLPLLS